MTQKQSTSDYITLKNINLKIRKGEFVCVIGDVASGKSSLLSAINGDMVYVSDSSIKELQSCVPSSKDFDNLANKIIRDPIV